MLTFVLLVVIGLIAGFLLGRISTTSTKPATSAKPPKISYGYTKLERKKVHLIHDNEGASWYMVRFGTSGAYCVRKKHTWGTSGGGRDWSSFSEEWFNWSAFQKQFPEYAHYGPQEAQDDHTVTETLTLEESAMLADYRKAREELDEVIRA
jgi:hypothetical protein